MTGKHRVAIALLVVLGLTPVGRVTAQTNATVKVAPAAAAEARKKLLAGQKLLKAKKWSEAEAELAASYALDAQVPALRGVAEAQEGAARFSLAHGTYERLLSSHEKQLYVHERKALAKRITELSAKTGLVTVTVAQAGAAISIDGGARGAAPLTAPVRLDPGEHKVRVSAEHRVPVERSVTIVAGQSALVDVDLPLEGVTGQLIVKESTGKPTRVIVDELEVGEAPWDGNLSPGKYRVSLVGDGTASEVREVEVRLGEQANLELEALPVLGHLAVEAPAGATVKIGGKRVGKGKVTRDLQPGEYELTVAAEGFQTLTKSVTIRAGETVIEKPVLQPKLVVAVAPPDPYRGFYGRVAGFGLASFEDGAKQNPACGDGAMRCDNRSPLGGGLGLQLGYGFGLLGIELSTSFTVDYAQRTQEFTGLDTDPGVGTTPEGALTGAYARKDVYDYTSYGSFAGLGLRLTSPGSSVRFSLGAAAGGVYRMTQLSRASLDDRWEANASGIAPALQCDLGLLFGATPGARFWLGIVARAEQGPGLLVPGEGPVTSTTPDGRAAIAERNEQTLRNGMQLFVGPTLGLQFGH